MLGLGQPPTLSAQTKTERTLDNCRPKRCGVAFFKFTAKLAAPYPGGEEMPNRKRTFTVALAVSISLLLTPTLAGCVNPFGGNPIGNVIKNATGGKVDIGGSSVPSDFPKEVPLINNDVVFATAIGSGDKKVWEVTVKVSSLDDFDKIKSQMESAGLTGKLSDFQLSGDSRSGVFVGDTYGALVVVTGDKDGYVASYTVATGDPTND